MKRHTVIGANILEEAVRQQHMDSFLAMAAEIARFHHERFDGSGYLQGLIGEEIPLSARIVAVADVYDALTSARPYKVALPTDKAKRMVEEESGKHFDPVIVAAFQKCFDDFLLVPQQVDRMNQATAESTLLHETKTPDHEQASIPEHYPDRKRIDSVMHQIAEQTDETECVVFIDGPAG